MWSLGLIFLTLGVLAEVLSGTNFRHLFDWRYPPSTVRWDDTRIKVLGGRLFLFGGLCLFVVGGLAELT
jgi:hypothetical protein